MEMLELIKERHSVRQYTDKKIEKEKRDILDKLTSQINQEAGLHIQILQQKTQRKGKITKST